MKRPAATLRFGDDHVASFVTSFNADDVAGLSHRGHERPCACPIPPMSMPKGLEYTATIDGKTVRKRVRKHDQFAAELLYFSDCIQNDREPEPSGEEGLQDVRIVQALYESAKRGRPVRIPPFAKTRRPTGRQRITRPGVTKPHLIKVQSASRD
jgi:glucose-fructose oxidoreductase